MQETSSERPAGGVLVVKFGGTSLGTPARIRRAARRVRAFARAGERVVVVVSATGHTTDRIVRWVEGAAPGGGAELRRELDRALATGEDLSAALLSAALLGIGVRAVSLRGAEAGIAGVGPFGAGVIERVDTSRLRRLLADGVVPVVSGFQAGRADGETVTLGRGGSDITAVFLAGVLGAHACHIVTDVDGVYDADPRLAPGASRYEGLSHESLIELTEGGAGVVHAAAARYAGRFRTRLHVYSYRCPFHPTPGTRIEEVAPCPA